MESRKARADSLGLDDDAWPAGRVEEQQDDQQGHAGAVGAATAAMRGGLIAQTAAVVA